MTHSSSVHIPHNTQAPTPVPGQHHQPIQPDSSWKLTECNDFKSFWKVNLTHGKSHDLLPTNEQAVWQWDELTGQQDNEQQKVNSCVAGCE